MALQAIKHRSMGHAQTGVTAEMPLTTHISNMQCVTDRLALKACSMLLKIVFARAHR